MTDAALRDVENIETFLDRLARGVPPRFAAYEVGWSPRDLTRKMKDPDFAQLVEDAMDRSIDSVEAKLFERAQDGNMAAIQLVLFNLRSDRWRDIKRVEITQSGRVDVNVVHSAKQAALELIREVGVGGLQQLSAGDRPTDIIDAEVITDPSA